MQEGLHPLLRIVVLSLISLSSMASAGNLSSTSKKLANAAAQHLRFKGIQGSRIRSPVLGICEAFYSNLLLIGSNEQRYQTVPTTSSKLIPVRVATNVSPMKLIERAGLMKISARNSFASITSGVLLVSSQTTRNSLIPLLACTSRRYGSVIFTKFARVIASLNSKSCARAVFQSQFRL